jgi:hypothetical protein
MFSYNWVVLHDFNFFWFRALVFGRCVEVTSSSGRFQFDFFATTFSHDLAPALNFAACTQISKNGINTVFVDGAQGIVGYAQANPAIFAFNPKLATLQVRQKAAFCFVVGVRNIVPYHWAFTRYLTYTSHDDPKFSKVLVYLKRPK